MMQQLKTEQSELRHALTLTRKDLSAYNNLRQEIAKIAEKTIEIDQRCMANLTSPDGVYNRLDSRTDQIEFLLSKEGGKAKGKQIVKDSIIKYSGWIVSLVLFLITLYTFLKSLNTGG